MLESLLLVTVSWWKDKNDDDEFRDLRGFLKVLIASMQQYLICITLYLFICMRFICIN